MVEVLLHVLNSFAQVEGRAAGIRDSGACLLLGEESCGKSALLFLAAAAVAARGGRDRVLFLAPRPLQALPPPLLRLEPGGLRRIQFAYPGSAEGLLEVLASLHQSPGCLPSLLLLDGLDGYLRGPGHGDRAHQAALISALLRDSAAWISETLPQRAQCQVIVTLKTLTQEETALDLGLPMIERYFPVKCVVKEELCQLKGVQRYLVSFGGLAKREAKGPPTSPSAVDCTWELLCEADNVTSIQPVKRERKEREESQDIWGSGEGTSTNP
ncbi:ATPase SWSAP1-like [Scyliorhinus torazame]|uniref:ATPase SWSAP1-like n=1 Tax=Scyliorhinus torazame TaxID=75743 RepID=UPI003B5C93FF